MLIVKLKRTLSLDFLENWASNDLILYFCFLSACRKNHTTDSCPCLQRLFHFFFTSEFLSTHTFLFSSREPRKIYQTSSWFGKIPRPPSSATHPRGRGEFTTRDRTNWAILPWRTRVSCHAVSECLWTRNCLSTFPDLSPDDDATSARNIETSSRNIYPRDDYSNENKGISHLTSRVKYLSSRADSIELNLWEILSPFSLVKFSICFKLLLFLFKVRTLRF